MHYGASRHMARHAAHNHTLGWVQGQCGLGVSFEDIAKQRRLEWAQGAVSAQAGPFESKQSCVAPHSHILSCRIRSQERLKAAQRAAGLSSEGQRPARGRDRPSLDLPLQAELRSELGDIQRWG